MNHMEAWLMYYDQYKDTGKESTIEATWCTALARVEGEERSGEKATEVMYSAMSACIISLRLIDVVP